MIIKIAEITLPIFLIALIGFFTAAQSNPTCQVQISWL